MAIESAAIVGTPSARPRFIARDGGYLFAWHHPPRKLRRGASVILCPPFGFDYICVYRTWRILAERLAELGFDVLRIDYEGTGNSADHDGESSRLTAWLQSIECAIAEARKLTGSSEVALVGLRLGATLALEAAAARGGVDRLVLWSPFRSGRAYVRELKGFAHLSRQNHVPEAEGPDIHVAGYVLTGTAAQEIATLDLNALAICPAPHVLVVDADDRPPDASVSERLETLGARVTRVQPTGTAAMLEQPMLSKVPEGAVDAITGWLRDWQPSGVGPILDAENVADVSGTANGPGYLERPLRFGPNDRLFGILSQPSETHGSEPAIIFLTTGCEHHVGPNRLYVPLARQWAARGHFVLRYDLGGIGDSAPPPGAAENIAYPEHALDDLREAIAFIRREAPGRRLVIAGLCSGGWFAFRAAREGLPVDAMVSVNPPLYLLDGLPGTGQMLEYSDLGNYRRALGNLSSWEHALRGRAAYWKVLRLSATYLRKKVKGYIGAIRGGRLSGGLARDLDGIITRRIASLFVFSRGDGALEYFQLHASPTLRRRKARGRIRHEVVDDAGHVFSPPDAQRALRRLLVDFVASQTSGTVQTSSASGSSAEVHDATPVKRRGGLASSR